MPGDRVIIAVTFVILGPFVGGVGFWCYVNFAAFLSGAANSWEAALSALPFMLLLGYLAGLVPAILSGFCYALLPAHWRRVVVALVIGDLATWLFGQFIDATWERGPIVTTHIFAPYIGSGVLAAAVSAFTARQIVRRRVHIASLSKQA